MRLHFDQGDMERIAEAIRRTETATSGEVFCVLARSSGSYRAYPLVLAFLLALLVPLPLLYLTFTSAIAIYSAQLATALVLALVFNLRAVRFGIVPKRVKHDRAHAEAQNQFAAHGLHQTQNRTGVLIFVSLAERYVDYRVALGQLRPPQDPKDPGALREALEARHKVRQQFFDGPEHDALFAREAELDRYTLARLEIERNPQLSAEQRAQALRHAENELPAARRAERAATTEHLNAAAQTAAFNAQNTDERTRHAARSAQYGEAAAHAMAQLDREEQHWQQRLDQYNQARGQQGEGPALQQLRQQLFSAEEQQRIDAALALRRLPPDASGS